MPPVTGDIVAWPVDHLMYVTKVVYCLKLRVWHRKQPVFVRSCLSAIFHTHTQHCTCENPDGGQGSHGRLAGWGWQGLAVVTFPEACLRVRALRQAHPLFAHITRELSSRAGIRFPFLNK